MNEKTIVQNKISLNSMSSGGLELEKHDKYSDIKISFSLAPRSCAPSEYSCSSGECVSRSSLCDGQNDCLDGDDEHKKHCNYTLGKH